MLTLSWFLFLFSFSPQLNLCGNLISISLCLQDENEQTSVHRVSPDHLFLTQSQVMLEPLFVTSLLFRKWGCSMQTITLQPSITSSKFLLPFALPCYWKQQNLGLLWEFLRRESICLYIIYLFTHWDMFSLPRHTRYVPTFSLQHVLQISSPPPLFPCFTLSVSCLREMLLTVNWNR